MKVDGAGIKLPRSKGQKMIALQFTEDEMDLLKAALSWLKVHADDAGDAMDIVVDEKQVDRLEKKIYGK